MCIRDRQEVTLSEMPFVPFSTEMPMLCLPVEQKAVSQDVYKRQDLLEVYLKNENYVVYKFYCATDAMSRIESIKSIGGKVIVFLR